MLRPNVRSALWTPWALAVFAALAAPTAASAQNPQQGPPPCSSDEASQFDFWLGSWEVRANGQIAGHNRITREVGGCVLHERYTTPQGYQGESFNIYDASRGVWHQTWVDNGGLLLTLEGTYSDGRMVLEGTTQGQNGASQQRITWSVIDEGPNVRQLWETSTDGGATWTNAFDGTYVPVDPESSSESASDPSQADRAGPIRK